MEQTEVMTKIEMMDRLLAPYGNDLTSAAIYDVIKKVFGIELDLAPLLVKRTSDSTAVVSSREVIDAHLIQNGAEMTGQEVRSMINHYLGVNLDGIASLTKAHISLYTKGQWILQHDTDLVVVNTGVGDIDVTVSSTSFYTEQTGLTGLPADLQEALTELGFTCNIETGNCSHTNPTGQAAPDSFKRQTMGAIIESVRKVYESL